MKTAQFATDHGDDVAVGLLSTFFKRCRAVTEDVVNTRIDAPVAVTPTPVLVAKSASAVFFAIRVRCRCLSSDEKNITKSMPIIY